MVNIYRSLSPEVVWVKKFVPSDWFPKIKQSKLKIPVEMKETKFDVPIRLDFPASSVRVAA